MQKSDGGMAIFIVLHIEETFLPISGSNPKFHSTEIPNPKDPRAPKALEQKKENPLATLIFLLWIA